MCRICAFFSFLLITKTIFNHRTWIWRKTLKNHWCQWSIFKKTFNSDGQGVAKPLKNHRWQWCPEKKALPSHRLKKWPSLKSSDLKMHVKTHKEQLSNSCQTWRQPFTACNIFDSFSLANAPSVTKFIPLHVPWWFMWRLTLTQILHQDSCQT